MIDLLRRAGKLLLDWTGTLLFLPTFGLLLVVFDPLQRIAYRFGRRPQELVVGWMQIGLVAALRLAGTRFTVERSALVQSWSPYLIVANHQSMFDIPILTANLFTNFPKFVSKRELGRGIPSISYNLQVGGNVLIDRKDRGQALDAIRTLAATVRERGVSAVIYPEGTRARTGVVGPFRPAGALELLRQAPDVPILPVAMDGQWRTVRHGMRPVPFGTRVRLWIGDPIARRPGEDPAALLAGVERQIVARIDRWRREAGEPPCRPEAGEACETDGRPTAVELAETGSRR